MKTNKNTLLILFCLTFVSCVMDSPMTYYSFTIKNNTDKIIIIDSKTIDDDYVHYDTLYKGQYVTRKILQLQCFTDYKETLIPFFFKSLKLKAYPNDLNIDPLIRKEWKENLDSLTIGKCKSGTCYYTLTIIENDIK